MNNYKTPFELINETYGVVADTDSYKLSHIPQYKKGATRMMSYIESRGGEYDELLWVGMNMIVKESLMKRLTMPQVHNMIAFAREHLMDNLSDRLEEALTKVVVELAGRLPIKIRAVPEGSIVPVKNVLATIETTIDDEDMFAIVSYFETLLLRVWAPVTVATKAFHIRKDIMEFLEMTADDPAAEIAFKLHDFGSRGTICPQSAMLAGLGHLAVFSGTDTTMAVLGANVAYNAQMTAFSIPASEHSTTTSHGEANEMDLITAMFDNFASPGSVFATVADSYDVIRFIREYSPQFKERLIESGATWVIRPDSCDPVEMPIRCVIELEKVFGCTVNSKGYKVLNNVRVIQGDGLVASQIRLILQKLTDLGYSASNMAFGMGGGLLQKMDRDTLKFSMKCCALYVNGEWIDVYKNPASYDWDWTKIVGAKTFKTSKAGRLELVRNIATGEYKTIRAEHFPAMLQQGYVSVLETIYENGELLIDPTWDEVKERAGTL